MGEGKSPVLEKLDEKGEQKQVTLPPEIKFPPAPSTLGEIRVASQRAATAPVAPVVAEPREASANPPSLRGIKEITGPPPPAYAEPPTAEPPTYEQMSIEKEVDPLFDLSEGAMVHYVTPNSWRVNSRNQRRAGLVAFCYRDAQGRPTGLVNLTLFLNGPADTGDMGGPRTRCLQFEAGVKFSAEGEQGCWTWAK